MTIDINDFENRVHEHLASGLMDHYRVQLAKMHGHRKLARRWRAELRTRLDRDLTVTLIHPVHGVQERRRVVEECVSSVQSYDAVLRQAMTRHVAEELGVPELEHGLDDADAAAFWPRVATVVDSCLEERRAEGDSPALSAEPAPPEETIHAILGKFVAEEHPSRCQKPARQVLVLDDDVTELAPALSEANFRVIQASASELSFDDLAGTLGHRILVTRKTQDCYIEHAPIHEYGILGLDALPHIDPSQSFATNTTAQLLSRAFLEHQLGFELSFVLMLHPQGRHVFRRIG